MRVLVIEDYPPTRKAVVKALREEGFSVDEAADGTDGLARASRGEYDVVVLDLMLPGIDGLEVLRGLRTAGSTAHVLVLTARDAVPDRIRGLDLGADDYLVKPFAVEELLARVRALLRREYRVKDPLIRVGHVEINTSNHQVRVDGLPVEFTAKEYALLEYLAMRTGQVVTRGDIWEHLYDDRSNATSNVVDVYIRYLRRKIEVDGRPRLIHTRRGEGYLLAAGPGDDAADPAQEPADGAA
jgi:two-component system, OmpR family, copper resistance phosphate regulon response regulator CusR